MKQSILLALAICLMVGCSRDSQDYVASFEPNLVHAMKYHLSEDIPKEVMETASQDAGWIVDGMFGTPDDPTLPEFLTDEDFSDLISLERIKAAAGPDAAGQGLYRKHCVSCHGITGNGRGENSAILDPYPRDYRKGVFKFKSTERRAKPMRDDLARVIRDGIAGTAMKKIPELSEDDVQALVDYVIYLSIRGELERTLIDDAVLELDLADGDRIVDRQFAESIAGSAREAIEKQVEAWEEAGENEDDPAAKLAEKLELYDESMEIAEDYLADIADAWLEAEDDFVDVPEPPADIPVANNYAEFVALSEGDQADAMAKSIERGKELFVGEFAACSKCHGKEGHGDGTNTDYDDWTKDWTKTVGLDPKDTELLIPLMARGAMPPKVARPRNFTEGVFRGGESAADLYRRISQGIAGSPMPGSTFVPDKYDEDDIWHLINFVRSIKIPSEDPIETEEPTQTPTETQDAKDEVKGPAEAA